MARTYHTGEAIGRIIVKLCIYFKSLCLCFLPGMVWRSFLIMNKRQVWRIESPLILSIGSFVKPQLFRKFSLTFLQFQSPRWQLLHHWEDLILQKRCHAKLPKLLVILVNLLSTAKCPVLLAQRVIARDFRFAWNSRTGAFDFSFTLTFLNGPICESLWVSPQDCYLLRDQDLPPDILWFSQNSIGLLNLRNVQTTADFWVSVQT